MRKHSSVVVMTILAALTLVLGACQADQGGSTGASADLGLCRPVGDASAPGGRRSAAGERRGAGGGLADHHWCLFCLECGGGLLCDRRTAFAGAYIANRVTDKITPVTDAIYCCRSGSAADTQAIADYVRYYLQLHQ